MTNPYQTPCDTGHRHDIIVAAVAIWQVVVLLISLAILVAVGIFWPVYRTLAPLSDSLLVNVFVAAGIVAAIDLPAIIAIRLHCCPKK